MAQKKIGSISVFYPCYNEQENIEMFVEEALKELPKVAVKFEIIIVNDGSTDDTAKVARSVARKNKKVRLVSHKENRGYGAALKTGFKSAKNKWVFFTDGDLQFKLSQLKYLTAHTNKYDVVIGYRKERAEGSVRAFNARLFKLYVDLLFRVGVKDIDCAFKLFKTELIQSIELNSDGAFTSAEMLYKLKKKHIKFKQVAVDHYERRFGTPTGNNINVIIKAGWEAMRLYIQIKIETLKK